MGSLTPSYLPEVTLRKFTLEDVKGILKWAGDDDATITTPNKTLQSEEEALAYYNSIIVPHAWYRAICVNGVPAGAIYITVGPGAHAVRGDLSYILAKEFWGKGIMSTVVKRVVPEGFKELHLARLQAYAATHNIGSQRVLEKTGFVKEGVLTNFVKVQGRLYDVFVYSVCRTPEPSERLS